MLTPTTTSGMVMHRRNAQCAPRTLSAPAQRPFHRVSRCVVVRAAQDSGPNPVRSAIGGLVSGIYKLGAMTSTVEPGLSPLWTAISKLDVSGVQAAVQSGADVNERNSAGDTPLLMIARQGHYKYPPAQIPAALVAAGADKEAKDKSGMTALQVSMLAGWQNIAELLIKSGADTSGVAAIKSRLTCPDCKALVVKYSL